jgi:hypothetical protein
VPVPGLSAPRHGLASLAAVSLAAMVFGVLLILVRLRWPPLESVDHGAAAAINRLIAGDHTLVTVVKAVTWLGSDILLGVVIGAAAAFLASGGTGCWRSTCWSPARARWCWTRCSRRWSAGCARW